MVENWLKNSQKLDKLVKNGGKVFRNGQNLRIGSTVMENGRFCGKCSSLV
jgi:hypothetical protein